VEVNGIAVPDVVPGRYLELQRHWKAGDRIDLSLDLSPRFWVGERECEGLTSVYRGPLLLAYDRRFNALDPDDLTALDARDSGVAATSPEIGPAPFVLLEYETRDGRKLRLCDFASAGAEGSPYRSWLKVDHASPSPFRRSSPLRSGPAVAV